MKLPDGWPAIARDGLWRNNQALVALLGLCPLLAVSTSVVNALALGLATTFAATASGGLIAALRGHHGPEIRLPIFMLIIAGNVTVIDLLMQALWYDLHRSLGIFVPLIVTNCAILGRAEAFASRNPVPRALADGFFVGLGFTAALVVLGALREFLASGALFGHADWLFGPIAKDWTWRIINDYGDFLLPILPVGAFIGLGLIIAARNWLDTRFNRKQP